VAAVELEGHPGTARPVVPRSSGREMRLSYNEETLLEEAFTGHAVGSALLDNCGLKQKTLTETGTLNASSSSARIVLQSVFVKVIPLYDMAYWFASLATLHAFKFAMNVSLSIPEKKNFQDHSKFIFKKKK
jgi:hypothetical protein